MRDNNKLKIVACINLKRPKRLTQLTKKHGLFMYIVRKKALLILIHRGTLYHELRVQTQVRHS